MNTTHDLEDTTMHTTPRRQRGYLLLEVMISGAITAVALATLMGNIAAQRSDSIIASRSHTANQLIIQRIEQAKALGYGTLSTTPPPASDNVGLGNGGTYKRTTVVTCAADAFGNFCDVAIGITFDKTTMSATTRVYQ